MAKKKKSARNCRSSSEESEEILSNTFEYEELGSPSEIRLIRVHSRSRKELGLRLEHFDLDGSEVPDYSALSYTWGQPTHTREIMVNRRVLIVRLNLYQFLEVFHAKHQNEWLWVDQICIDQQNTRERNAQVQLMTEIYRSAFEVKIWLGPDHHPDERIFRERVRGVSASRALKQDSLQDLFEKSYWSRLWILQEILLARRRKIYYGYDFIDWSRFQDLCELGNKEALVRAPEHIRWLSRRATTAREILVCDAVLHCTDNECSDPRDKIYGIQSLFAEEHRLIVDYEKSVEQVFLDAAIMIAESVVCVIGEGHAEVCPDAPAECECLPLGEMEQIMLSIDHLASAMGMVKVPQSVAGVRLEVAVQEIRDDSSSSTKSTLAEHLKGHYQLPRYE